MVWSLFHFSSSNLIQEACIGGREGRGGSHFSQMANKEVINTCRLLIVTLRPLHFNEAQEAEMQQEIPREDWKVNPDSRTHGGNSNGKLLSEIFKRHRWRQMSPTRVNTSTSSCSTLTSLKTAAITAQTPSVDTKDLRKYEMEQISFCLRLQSDNCDKRPGS